MTDSKNKLKEIMNDKKKRGRVYWGIFLFILAILFVVNNINSEEKPGPYPPDYWKLKRSANQLAPAFTLNSIENKKVTLEDYKDKVVLLQFWDTGCRTSKKMVTALIKLKENFKNKSFEILSVSLDTFKNTPAEKVKTFAKENRINYPVLIGDEITNRKYGTVSKTPVIYMIKKDGIIYTRYDDWMPYSILERDVKLLLDN